MLLRKISINKNNDCTTVRVTHVLLRYARKKTMNEKKGK